MLQLLVLAAIGAVIFKTIAPVPAFLRGFGGQLSKPERGRAGVRALFSGARYVGGEYEGRPVVLVVYPRRGRRLGYLTLAFATTTEQPWDGSQATEGAQVSTPRMREALDALIGRHGLSLELERGWLRATWKPLGLFIFPGRFDAEKWRDVTAQMHALAAELEEAERNPAAKHKQAQGKRKRAKRGADSSNAGAPLA